MTLGASSSPPASSNSTLTSGFSARRRATTDPEEPDPDDKVILRLQGLLIETNGFGETVPIGARLATWALVAPLKWCFGSGIRFHTLTSGSNLAALLIPFS
jgi:hypothetical protein